MAEVGCLKDGHFQNLQVESRTSLSGGHLNTVVLSGGGTKVLTAANSGATCVFDNTGVSTFTLPEPELGMRFTFITTILATGDHKIVAGTSPNGFLGGVISVSQTASKDAAFLAAADGENVVITLDGGARGGAPGTRIEVVGVKAPGSNSDSCWVVSGQVACVGASTANPFSNS